MDKEHRLMTSHFAASIVDASVSMFGLNLEGFRDKGFAGSSWAENDQISTAAIVRVGVTAALIGLYALNRELNTRFAFSYEKALSYTNFIVWGANLSNIAQVVHHLYLSTS